MLAFRIEEVVLCMCFSKSYNRAGHVLCHLKDLGENRDFAGIMFTSYFSVSSNHSIIARKTRLSVHIVLSPFYMGWRG
jgi:hypothetical protein